MNIIDLKEINGVYVPIKTTTTSKKEKPTKQKPIKKSKASEKIEVQVVRYEKPQASPAEDFMKGMQVVFDIFDELGGHHG